MLTLKNLNVFRVRKASIVSKVTADFLLQNARENSAPGEGWYAFFMKYIVVASCTSEMDANIAKGFLESKGIPCKLRMNPAGDAMLGGFGVQNGGMEVLVDMDHVEKAMQILEEHV